MPAQIMGKAGVSVVDVPAPDLYSALEKGVVDGVGGWARVSNWDKGIHEVTHWIIRENFHQPASCLGFMVNMDSWEKLPPDLKDILESAVKEYGLVYDRELKAGDEEALKKMFEYGNEEIDWPDSETAKLRDLAIPVWEQWAAKSPLATKIYESQLAYMKSLGLV